MRRIVNGKLYNTDNSTLLYSDSNKKRKLFVTSKGNYFTLYVTTGEIVPRSEETVRDYLGTVDVDKYIEVFGKVEDA